MITLIEQDNGNPIALLTFKNDVDCITFLLETDFKIKGDSLVRENYIAINIDENGQKFKNLIRELQAVFYSNEKLTYGVSYYTILFIRSEFCEKFIQWRYLTELKGKLKSKDEEIYLMSINYESFLKKMNIIKGENKCQKNF